MHLLGSLALSLQDVHAELPHSPLGQPRFAGTFPGTKNNREQMCRASKGKTDRTRCVVTSLELPQGSHTVRATHTVERCEILKIIPWNTCSSSTDSPYRLRMVTAPPGCHGGAC